MKLTDVQKRSIFKALANKSQYAVGVEFGFDKHYKSNTSVVNAVNKVYRQVKEAPEAYSLNQEMLEIVENGMASRRSGGVLATREFGLTNVAQDNPENLDSQRLVLGARNKAWVLLNRKLDIMMKSKKSFNGETLMALAKVAGIAFDKGQIVSGEATEHIALKAKIDPNITSGEALAQLLSFREGVARENE